ncbi:hypothetical protein [Rhodopila sp.]|uniref:hypothetical protein n=1 Tax=Rhodopila sp. TaxID=2480087 RepID=UPI003D13B611
MAGMAASSRGALKAKVAALRGGTWLRHGDPNAQEPDLSEARLLMSILADIEAL